MITVLAVTFGAAGGLGGLWASSRWNVAAGAAITLTATAILLISLLLAPLPRTRPSTRTGSKAVPA